MGQTDSQHTDVLLRSLLAFFVIGFALWLGIAWGGYASSYAQATEGWRKGGVHLVELTVVADDSLNLACASDASIDTLTCGYARSGAARRPVPDDARTLRPYLTVKDEPLLGAGLWTSPALRGALPRDRFTVSCNFHVDGVVKTVGLRWARDGQFEPATKSVAAGRLSDCVLPP